MSSNAMSRRSALRAGLTVLGGAALAACTPAATPVGAPQSGPSSATPSSPPPDYGVAPLTGLPATAPGLATRQAVVVDLYLDGGAPAVTGLDAADVVFEEVIGRDARRLMAVYQSRDAARVGPVGDTWPSDIRTLPVLRPLVASRGGWQKFSNVLGSTDGLTDVSYPGRSTAYTTQPGARSPYNVYTSTPALYRLVTAGAAAPPALLPLQQEGLGLASIGIVAAQHVSITVPGEPARVWSYDATTKAWHRAGSTIAATNLAVLVMPYRAVQTSNHGGYIHTAEVFGSGTAWVAAGPAAVHGSWSRKGAFGASLVIDEGGLPTRVLPGTTWMFYAPTGTAVVIS
jgi:hypothetical protein